MDAKDIFQNIYPSYKYVFYNKEREITNKINN